MHAGTRKDGDISIHVPTRGTTAPRPPIYIPPYFNPRAYARHDAVSHASRSHVPDFNPRAYARHDGNEWEVRAAGTDFNPRAYARHDGSRTHKTLRDT